MFIAVEGIDGSGKSTLAKLMEERLRDMGYSVHLTREPTDRFRVTFEESSRHDVQTAVELFFRFTEDRLYHQEEISKNLEANRIVITDRYIASSLAYQGALIEPLFGSAEKTIEWMQQVSRIIGNLPDLTLYLDVEPDTALKRVRKRGEFSGFEQSGYLEKVREYYTRILSKKAIVLDSSVTMDELVENAMKAVLEKLG